MMGGGQAREAGPDTMIPLEIEKIALNVMASNSCHTVIVYGSQARGDATPESDIDLLCIRAEGPPVRDARTEDGIFIDAFVYPESALASVDPTFLRLLGGVVLREEGGIGTALLARVKELEIKGPTALAADERQALVVWSTKTLERIRKGGVEAQYRRAGLLVQSLEDYFSLRGIWFRGSKVAFGWLRDHDPKTYAAFEAAFRPEAGDEALAKLVSAVYGPSLAQNANRASETETLFGSAKGGT